MSNPLARFIKGPFIADKAGGIVWNGDHFHFADVRGWGELKYLKDGEEVQDYNLQFTVDALNEKLLRREKEVDFSSVTPLTPEMMASIEAVAANVGAPLEFMLPPEYVHPPLAPGQVLSDGKPVTLVSNRQPGKEIKFEVDKRSLFDVVELQREVEWLRFYKKEVYHCLGPADDDINTSIRRAYVKEVGTDKLPKTLRVEHEDYEADHAKEE